VVSKGGDGLDEAMVCGARAALSVVFDDGVARQFHGIVAAVDDSLETEAASRAYRIQIVPRLHWLDLVTKQEIYLDKSLPDIIQTKLGNAAMAEGEDFELRLSHDYPEREFVTQYKETDLDFLARVCEHRGISFFLEPGDDHDRVVFTDHAGGFSKIDGEVHYQPRGEEASVYQLERKLRLRPQQFFVTDFNYRTPQIDLTASAAIDDIAVAGGVVEYGSHTKDPAEAEYLAKVRSQAADAERCRYVGKSSLARFTAGHVFELEGHAALPDAELLLVEVVHEMSTAVFQGADDQTESYKNEFVAVPAKLDYRPPLRSPRPRIHGVVNAVVMGAPEQPSKPLIDDEGRYFVRFAFDVEGPADEGLSSRPIRMAQPHAGTSYGMHFPLKPGVEVVVVFIDGDPDRPIIVGAVPNTVTPSPVTDSNRMVNKLKTSSGCVLEFFDADG
jgi:type VI secretion system secreted protein VgrG